MGGGGVRVKGSGWGWGKGQREWLGVGEVLVWCGRISCFVRVGVCEVSGDKRLYGQMG